MSDWSDIPDSMIDSDEEGEELRDWDALLGSENQTKLLNWLGDHCPAYICLHRGRLHNNIWENTSGNSHSDRRQKYEEKICTAWKEIYQLCQHHFEGKLWERFQSIPKTEDEEEEWEILEDFWADLQQDWMLVANGDARELLKPLKNSHDIITLAKIHHSMAMSNANMTALSSAICKMNRPDIHSVLRTIENINEKHVPDYSSMDEYMWNFPAATDTLKFLVSLVEENS